GCLRRAPRREARARRAPLPAARRVAPTCRAYFQLERAPALDLVGDADLRVRLHAVRVALRGAGAERRGAAVPGLRWLEGAEAVLGLCWAWHRRAAELRPDCGRRGKLLDRLLAGIGLTRADVYVANTLKCRPPGNRDPMPDEKHECERWLFRQIELIGPKVVATLGNHATKQLTGKETGITRVHGQPQRLNVGALAVLLYPLYHPAAALYTPAMFKVLEEDFARLPELLGAPVPEPAPVVPLLAPPPAPEAAVQLGL